MALTVGIVGAGKRGFTHAEAYGDIDGVAVEAVADIDDEAATDLAETHSIHATFSEYRQMLDDTDLDIVSVCVHNALHRPVTVAAADAGCHVFCEKPMAPTYADAKAMADAADAAGVELAVQNNRLFTAETRAAKHLVDEGHLGDPFFGQAVYSRRRGRPYIDGYGTPAFVTADSAGGGPVLDIGSYVIGQLLYLFGNPSIDRVSGATFELTDAAYGRELVGETQEYTERLDETGYDVEDIGFGFIRLSDESLLSLRAAWHLFLPENSSALAGGQGGINLDPFEFYTTTADYETTTTFDLDEYERRQGLLASESGYDQGDAQNQFQHWVDRIRDELEAPIPTAEIALNSMVALEGIYLADEAGHELSRDAIIDRSTPHETS